MKRSPAKKLAASFVVTFAALPACQSATPTTVAPTSDVPVSNPPGPVPTPSSGPIAADSTTPTTSPTIHVNPPPPPPPSDTASTLPPAPTGSGWAVNQRADGTCYAYSQARCPPSVNGHRIICNPPPPHAVQCPPDAGP